MLNEKVVREICECSKKPKNTVLNQWFALYALIDGFSHIRLIIQTFHAYSIAWLLGPIVHLIISTMHRVVFF